MIYLSGRYTCPNSIESEEERHEEAGNDDVPESQQTELALDTGGSVGEHSRKEQLDGTVERLCNRYLQ